MSIHDIQKAMQKDEHLQNLISTSLKNGWGVHENQMDYYPDWDPWTGTSTTYEL